MHSTNPGLQLYSPSGVQSNSTTEAEDSDPGIWFPSNRNIEDYQPHSSQSSSQPLTSRLKTLQLEPAERPADRLTDIRPEQLQPGCATIKALYIR